jgi:GNAT superfamily N-acetyltransferase
VTSPFVVREARQSDLAFVTSSWKESFLARARALITREILRAIDRGRVLVACDKLDEDALVGFAAFGDDELHYVYVKEAFRKEGAARDLLEGQRAGAYTFRTDIGESRLKPEARGLVYKPRIIL